MITGMDRLVAAINGEKSDRIPVFCNLLDQGAAELGISSLEEYYSNGEHVAEAQLKMREKYGHDNVWSLFYVGKEAELLGCEKIIFSKSGPPNVEDYVIKSYDDIVNLEIPDDISTHPGFEENLKCLNILKREVGGTQPICAYLTAGITLPAILMGMDKWLELLLMGPTDIRDLLIEKCSDFFQREAAAFRKAGADVLVYSQPFGSTDIMPMRLIKELTLPSIKRDLEPGGMDGMVYYCGSSPFNNVIDMMIEKFGFGVFYLSPKDDIAEAKKIINGRALTCGVINDIKLVSWSREEIRAEVKRMLDAGMPGGKFLFGTLVMPYDIPEKNIRAMLEAAYEYGSY
ncbi:uroporphyrinogen decarboxylase [Mariprofundus aestuarium]|uniref:Uroporphyrinogen decarboxylase n=1 Tax=Mariprofundus aestuarium TaxID=1921086 RepID=A0A2K8L173_MARES|nr:uroporphyrinogen decarboxylase family protein [Mariprofundus aestuarium]ATX78674.1 uroporphyrinogen decarboxylase [Mariprofundus aestuarium]